MTTITNPALFPEVAVSNSLSSVCGGKADSPGKQDAAVKKTTQDFEALFIGMMLKSMRSTVGKDS